MNTILLYHTDNDGFGAYLAFEEYAEFEFDAVEFEYGQRLPANIEVFERIIFCDVVGDLNEIGELLKRGNDIIFLDHHISLYERIEGEFSWFKEYGNFIYYYDPNASGAVIAYRFLMGLDSPVPILLRYVEDRDLWKWEMEESKEVNAGLDSVPKKVDVWRAHLHDVSSLVDSGYAVLAHINATVQLISKNTYDIFGDNTVAVCNCTSHWSEVGNYVVEELGYNTAFLYYELPEGGRKWSIRGENAKAYAEARGGGGHPKAAGFIEPEIYEPSELVIESLVSEVRSQLGANEQDEV